MREIVLLFIVATFISMNVDAGTEKLYKVCYKNKANAPLICESEKLNKFRGVRIC